LWTYCTYKYILEENLWIWLRLWPCSLHRWKEEGYSARSIIWKIQIFDATLNFMKLKFRGCLVTPPKVCNTVTEMRNYQ
jgi:hypothetical protein